MSKNNYQPNMLSVNAKIIPYNKVFRLITKSVTASILWQQLEYWFFVTKGKPFFKYMSPLEKEKGGYKFGDSWEEELGFSTFEFKNAFKKIGTSYNSKTEFDQEIDKFKGKMYCSYYDKINHQTIYIRDEKGVNTNLARIRNLLSGDKETSSRDIKFLNVDNIDTTENTTENTTYIPADEPQEKFNFQEKLSLMKSSNDKRMPIIATYWEAKGFSFNCLDSYKAALKRELRSANNLLGYDINRIVEVLFWLIKNTDFKPTLESVHKYIDEDISKLKPFNNKFNNNDICVDEDLMRRIEEKERNAKVY